MLGSFIIHKGEKTMSLYDIREVAASSLSIHSMRVRASSYSAIRKKTPHSLQVPTQLP